VSLDTFVSYGEAFQKRFVPDLEKKRVVLVEPAPHGFNLSLRTERSWRRGEPSLQPALPPLPIIPLNCLAFQRESSPIVPTLAMPAISPAAMWS